jgi:hypothetical protein
METPHRIIVERLLQERRSEAAAERIVRQARHAAWLDGQPRALSRPDGSATVDCCSLPQRAG